MNDNQPIRIVKVIDYYTVVINKGSNDGIKSGHRFLIYSIDDEPLIDPVTNKSLGNLEIVKGTVKVKHIQDSITTLESDSYIPPSRKIIKRKSTTIDSWLNSNNGTTEEIVDEKELKPLDDPSVGDFVKLI